MDHAAGLERDSAITIEFDFVKPAGEVFRQCLLGEKQHGSNKSGFHSRRLVLIRL